MRCPQCRHETKKPGLCGFCEELAIENDLLRQKGNHPEWNDEPETLDIYPWKKGGPKE